MTVKEYPDSLEKKMKLLSYFKRYMNEHLVKAGQGLNVENGDVLSRIPHLHTWFRTTCAVVMHLTNGSVQVTIDTLVVLSLSSSSPRTPISNYICLFHFS